MQGWFVHVRRGLDALMHSNFGVAAMRASRTRGMPAKTSWRDFSQEKAVGRRQRLCKLQMAGAGGNPSGSPCISPFPQSHSPHPMPQVAMM
jgi:hypothetical protein